MKLKSVEKLENGKVCLEIQVEKSEFDVAMNKSYHKNAPKITVPGFRKGKAPRKIIERMYGENVFTEDAVNFAYPDAYEAALAESGYEPVEQADVELLDMSNDGFSVKATVTVKPEVTLGKYTGIEAEKPEVSVAKKDIDAEINQMLERNARLVTVDREAKDGDTVIIDFEGFVDDVAFEGGKGENHSLKLGSNQFIPGFEEQLIGKKAGEDTDVNVTFPTEYHSDELAGKSAVFKVKVHEVKETELPTADDEFAKDVSEFDSLDELKKSIEKKLLDERAKMSDEAFDNAVLDEIVKDMTVELPEIMIENQLDKICDDFSNRLGAQGLTLEQYLQMMQSDMDSFRKNFRDGAEHQVKVQLALEAIAKAEKLEPTSDDVEEEYKRLAEQFGMPIERVRGYIPEDAMKSDLYNIKASRFVHDNAIAKAPVKKAAKKPAAKTAETDDDKEKNVAKKPAAKKTAAKKPTAAKETDAKPAAKKPAAKKTAAKKAADKE